MSNLKHLSVDELRREIFSLSAARETQLALAHTVELKMKEMEELATAHRANYYNWGQREVWARIYLARKETGQ